MHAVQWATAWCCVSMTSWSQSNKTAQHCPCMPPSGCKICSCVQDSTRESHGSEPANHTNEFDLQEWLCHRHSPNSRGTKVQRIEQPVRYRAQVALSGNASQALAECRTCGRSSIKPPHLEVTAALSEANLCHSAAGKTDGCKHHACSAAASPQGPNHVPGALLTGSKRVRKTTLC